MFEPDRKHGPFDGRFPVRTKLAAPLQQERDGAERLDWPAFVARFYPNHHRHDFAALAAYQAGDREPVSVLEPADAWESEGGASR